MTLSIAGVFVTVALLLLGRFLGSPVFIGLFAALPFGSTAIVAIGQSTPLLFTAFQALAVLALVLNCTKLKTLFGEWADWLILALALYVMFGSVILPRLFAGDIIVPGGYVEGAGSVVRPLAPVSGNLNQAGYFILGCGTYFAFRALLSKGKGYFLVRRGFLLFALLNVVLGTLDIAGKMVGIDVLSAIRTASYEFRTLESVGGFWRIVGGFPEASAYAAAGVTALAFCFSYWRATGSRSAFVLATWQLALLVVSTSSTAYVALCVVAVPVGASIVLSLGTNRVSTHDLFLVGAGVFAIAVVILVYLITPSILYPFIALIQDMVFSKAASASGVERAYWNTISIEAFVESFGLGIGIGTTRASSWLIAVLSQLGVIGSIAIAALVFVLVRGRFGAAHSQSESESAAIAGGTRAAGIVSLVPASLAGGSADPGAIFFIALAVIISSRSNLRATAHSANCGAQCPAGNLNIWRKPRDA